MISIVIHHKEGDECRGNNLKYVLQYYSNINDAEIVLVEQDTIRKVENNNYKNIFIETNSLYNRSLGLDIGLLNSESDIVLLCDNDVLVSYENIDKAISMIKEQGYEFIYPYENFMDLNEGDTKEILLGNKNPIDCQTTERYNNKPSSMTVKAGGSLIVNKQSFLNAGLMNYSMRGWGAEDDDFFHRIKNTGMKMGRTNGTMYHLYHPRMEYSEIAKTEAYQRNVSILNQILNMNKDELILYGRTLLNNIDKYCEDNNIRINK